MEKILVIDDDDFILSAFKRTLKKQPWQIDTYNTPAAALEASRNGHWELIITDYRMPKMDGIELLQNISPLQPQAIKIIMSANIDLEGLSEALNRASVHRFITKPWDDTILVTTIKESLQYQQLLAENKRLADEIRIQKKLIDHQQAELQRLETESPGITQVNWDDDGSIILSEDDI